MAFLELYYSHVYFLFHEGFTNVEASLAQKGTATECLNSYKLLDNQFQFVIAVSFNNKCVVK